MVDVWKRVGVEWVLRGVTLTVRGLVNLVGPNGSGKTTLVRILVGLSRPSRGRVLVDGEAPPTHPRVLGFVLHTPTLIPELTVKENLRLFASVAGVDWRTCVLGVCKVFDKPVKALSFGWRRRVDIARAVLPDPPNLVLDEPMTGLDDEARGELMDIVRRAEAALVTSPVPFAGRVVNILETSSRHA